MKLVMVLRLVACEHCIKAFKISIKPEERQLKSSNIWNCESQNLVAESVWLDLCNLAVRGFNIVVPQMVTIYVLT